MLPCGPNRVPCDLAVFVAETSDQGIGTLRLYGMRGPTRQNAAGRPSRVRLNSGNHGVVGGAARRNCSGRMGARSVVHLVDVGNGTSPDWEVGGKAGL